MSKARRIDHAETLPLSVHEVDLSVGDGGLQIAVRTCPFPEGRTVTLLNLFPSLETVAELRELTDRIEALLTVGAS